MNHCAFLGKPTIALAAILLVGGLLGTTPAQAGSVLADAASLGYSPQNMDKTVDPRQDFYRYAAGNWLQRTAIAPSDPDVGCRWADGRPAVLRGLDADVGVQGAFRAITIPGVGRCACHCVGESCRTTAAP
jgi:hypothetical protein